MLPYLKKRHLVRRLTQCLSKLTVLTHHHINFNGIYNFPDKVADWNLPFDLSTICDL